MNYVELYNRLQKYAAEVLTPEAEQAAMQGGDPAAQGGMPPQGGMPMDPAMMQQGGGMPPQGAPMDPSMGGGMPPQGAPMDPSMMPPQGAPMDPSMGGGMPPQGGAQIPPEAYQDQQFLQMLQELAGITLDQASGQFIDQTGQTVPPDVIMQAWQAYQQQMQMSGGAPMDPSMAGGMPPEMPPEMPEGDMPGMGGMPPEADMPEEQGMDLELEERLSAIEKREAILLKKIDTLQASIDSLQISGGRKAEEADAENADLNAALAAELAASGDAQAAVPPDAVAAMANKQASYSAPKAACGGSLNIFSLISGIN